jgi:hypothetical protein
MKKLILSLLTLSASSAIAASPELIGNFGKWRAYKADDVCFAACQPEKSEGSYTSRGDTFLMVSHRPKEKVRDEISTIMGYAINTNSPAEILIDDKTKYELQTTPEAAFAKDDSKTVNSMKKGMKLVIHATSSRGTLTTDTYSLNGFTKANEAAQKACKS